MLQNFTQWINENSEYSTEGRLADLEHLYDLGMIDSEDLIRTKIKIQSSTDQLKKLTYSEVALLNSEVAEEIEEWVKEDALDIMWDLPDSPEEEEAFEDYITEAYNLILDWQVYLDGTIDVSIYYDDLGPEQRISWTDADGTVKSRDILEYYKESVMRHLDPTAITGRIQLSRYVIDLVQELISDLTNNNR